MGDNKKWTVLACAGIVAVATLGAVVFALLDVDVPLANRLSNLGTYRIREAFNQFPAADIIHDVCLYPERRVTD